MALQKYLESGRMWTSGVFNDLHSTLEYEVRLLCGSHYFGIDCDTFCRPRDDPLGHFTCSLRGEKVCLNGYEKNPDDPEGDYCTQGNIIQLQTRSIMTNHITFICSNLQTGLPSGTWVMRLTWKMQVGPFNLSFLILFQRGLDFQLLDAKTVGRVRLVTPVFVTRAANVGRATHPGHAIVTKAGEVFYVTKISTFAQPTNHA